LYFICLVIDILGTLDDKIENNTKKAEEYEKMIELYFEQLLPRKQTNGMSNHYWI